MNTTDLVDDITTALNMLLDQAQAGFMFDPEVDFSSMRATTDANQADLKIYEKTGKHIALQRVHRPVRLVIFLDINCNLRIAFQHNKLGVLLCQIIDSIAKDAIVELRDKNNQNISAEWQHIVSSYTQKTYESGINNIVEYATYESDEGNIILTISDFLDLDTSNVDLDALHIVYLQVQLPVVSSYFHHFYLEPLKKPDVANWFVL